MNFIKNHKILVFVISFLIVLMIIIGVGIIDSSSSVDPNSKYGNRLVGIEKVEISDSRLQNIKEKILNDKNTNQTTYKIDGRIIKFFIEFKPQTDELTVESLLNLILENFTDEEKKFYDFEVFITNEEEKEELYPMIAYKHRNNVTFTITKKAGEKNEE